MRYKNEMNNNNNKNGNEFRDRSHSAHVRVAVSYRYHRGGMRHSPSPPRIIHSAKWRNGNNNGPENVWFGSVYTYYIIILVPNTNIHIHIRIYLYWREKVATKYGKRKTSDRWDRERKRETEQKFAHRRRSEQKERKKKTFETGWIVDARTCVPNDI